MFLHIDCNCFFVSCELVFRPDLQHKPVVVANVNETGGGIILALNKEAKAIGLKRGNPIFKVKDILNDNNVTVFPTNHNKYVDISKRIMQIVREQEIVQNIVQYSVDEFFGEIPVDNPDELRPYIERVKDAITRGSGIPVCCGAANSYTLAKVATWYAKHYNGFHEICILPPDKREKALAKLPINEVWGIGRHSSERIITQGITTALAFANKDEYHVHKLLGKPGVDTWKELNGKPAIELSGYDQPQKSIMHSRTFSTMLTEKAQLQTELSNFAVATARKLRDQHSFCNSITVFLATNRFREDLPQYRNSATARLDTATNDSRIIINKVAELIDHLFVKGYHYKSAGVQLGNLQSAEACQLNLFEQTDLGKSQKLMDAMDSINKKFGMNKIHFATQGNEARPVELSGFQKPTNQTTDINDIIQINCKK